MIGFHSWIARGDWRSVFGEVEALFIDGERAVVEDLRQALESVVPVLEGDDAGEGPLAKLVRARQADADALRKHVGSGRYEAAMRQLCAARGRSYNGSSDMDECCRQLGFAAASLEFLEEVADTATDLDPHDRWLVEAKEVAVNKLRDEGIDYRGLTETFVLKDGRTKRWRSAKAGEPHAIPIEQVLELPSSERRSTVRLAVGLLIHARELDKVITAVRASAGVDGDEGWTDQQMLDQSFLVGESAIQIGIHLGALDAKRIERAATAGLKAADGASAGGRARGLSRRPTTDAILSAIEVRTVQGHSIANAARLTFEKDGLGTSSGANERLWWRYQGTRKP